MKARSAVATLLVALTAVAAAPALAQTVRGTVLDTLSGAPVGRGFVVLFDSTGREVARTLSRSDGRFAIGAPAPGVYRLRSERIGYRIWESGPFTLAAQAAMSVVLQITSLPVRLDAIEVRGTTTCRDPSGNVDTGALWEEARKALAAASWAANKGGYLHVVHRFRRRWNRRRTRIEWEKIGSESGSARLPFEALQPDSLAAAGYVIPRGVSWDWYAPDANVLLDQTFHATHCFHAVRGKDEFVGMLGLEFEPVPDRKVPDIKGTLWIDEGSSELRRIEYRFTNAPGSVRDDRIGGSILFQSLPTGAWIVERWVIRLGEAEVQPSFVRGLGEQRTRVRVGGFLDEGGQVIGLYDFDGSVLYQSPETVEIYGTVFDSIRGIPLRDERVWIVGTGYETFTDDNGQYVIDAILDGEYELTSERLDSLGYLPGRVGRRFSPGDTVHLDLAVPGRLTVSRALCPEIGIPADTRALVGSIQNDDGNAVSEVWVAAIWNLGVAEHERKMIRFRTDKDGRYVLCNVPVGPPIQIEVLVEELEGSVAELSFQGDMVEITQYGATATYRVPDRILRLDLEVPAPVPVRR